MKKIVLFGAGKSAGCLIDYLVGLVAEMDWFLTLVDADHELAQSKLQGATKATAVSINVEDGEARSAIIDQADLVISLLPPWLHLLIAKDCLAKGKNLLNASYIDEDLRLLESEIKAKKLLFLCEMGLDPGIDHMSAMRMIHAIKKTNGNIISLKSHCGGLVAPESDNNPWHYKVSWNPRNIILAGSAGAEYLLNKKITVVPYTAIFRNPPPVHISNVYPLSWYPNRSSLRYIDLYELDGIETFVRTTLRHPAFCRGWSKLVNIGLTATDDFEQIRNCTTFKEWFNIKTARYTSIEKDWNNYLQLYITDPFRDEFAKQMAFLKLDRKDPLPPGFTGSADILQWVLEERLPLSIHDRDMVVMIHEIEYLLDNTKHTVHSELIVKGIDSVKTAMAKSVGLPLGIAAKFILQGKINLEGLHIPTLPVIYEQVLPELERNGIRFEETTT